MEKLEINLKLITGGDKMMFGDRVFKEMYDLMAEMEREFNAMRKEYAQDYKMPVMDMYETDDELIVIMELPWS
jgi:HSP20 family protein